MPSNRPPFLMDRHFKEYRAGSSRLPGWDYSSPGGYFVTICTEGNKHFFGEILDDNVKLNIAGKIAQKCWLEIPEHHGFVSLDAFIVMPNHLHGILLLSNGESTKPPKRRFGSNQKGSVSIVVQTYKAAVTRFVRREGIRFAWQRNYYEHIVCNENDLNRIRKYIRNNMYTQR